MPTSAFKSTSRTTTNSSSSSSASTHKRPGPGPGPTNPAHKGPLRRSRSVSALQRGAELDITSEFHNKRDNPLFWVDGSPSDGENEVKVSKFDEISARFKGLGDGNCGRGRSILRNGSGGGGGGRKDVGRSLSRVDASHRRRSPSRGRCGNYMGDKNFENDMSKLRSKSKMASSTSDFSNENCKSSEQKNKLARSTSDSFEVLKGRNTWSSQHPAFESSDDSAISLSGSHILDICDVRSTSSVSEAEERNFKPISMEKKISGLLVGNATTGGILETVHTDVRRAMYEIQDDVKHAMLRSNSDNSYCSILSEIIPELENPNEGESMRDFRGEYVRELEECEKRTRKLRAELAAEEHRELELNEILCDIIPEPNTPQMPKPQPLRKGSFERRKMSRRLEEEAMAYFDECVSISTFDDSDFSSFEDPPSNVVRFRDPGDEIAAVSGAPVEVGTCPFENQDISRQSLLMRHDQSSRLPDKNSCCNNDSCTTSSNEKTKPEFSFSSKSSLTTLEQDIKVYVKNLAKEKSVRDGDKSQTVSSGNQNTSDFPSHLTLEKFIFDRMKFKSRIESGSMLLCGAYLGFPVTHSSSLW